MSASLLRTEENQESCKYLCAIGFAASYGVLVLVQAALVFAPGRPLRLVSSRGLGLTIPAAALIVGVTVAQIGGGADFLTALAAVATPLLAAGAGWARGWRLPWLPALCVPPLYAVAWLRPDAWASDLAEVALIAGACLAITGLVAGVAPRSWLTAGLVLLVVLDVILVWGDRQVEPTMNALLSAEPPTIGRPLPELQQVDFGSATMGWLDFAAPALLGLLVQRRVVAGVATGLAAGLWGLLLLATSPIAATLPVLVGLIAGRKPPRSTATVETTQGRAGVDGRRGLEAYKPSKRWLPGQPPLRQTTAQTRNESSAVSVHSEKALRQISRMRDSYAVAAPNYEWMTRLGESPPTWLTPIERRRRRSWWSTSAHSVAGSAP